MRQYIILQTSRILYYLDITAIWKHLLERKKFQIFFEWDIRLFSISAHYWFFVTSTFFCCLLLQWDLFVPLHYIISLFSSRLECTSTIYSGVRSVPRFVGRTDWRAEQDFEFFLLQRVAFHSIFLYPPIHNVNLICVSWKLSLFGDWAWKKSSICVV